MTLAGTPTAVHRGGMFPTTAAPAPITASSLMTILSFTQQPTPRKLPAPTRVLPEMCTPGAMWA